MPDLSEFEIDGATSCAIRNALWKVGHDLEDDGHVELSNLIMAIGYCVADAQGNPVDNIADAVKQTEDEISKAAFRCVKSRKD